MTENIITFATLNVYGNILWSKLKFRHKTISQELNKERIDLINFQEVYTYPGLNILRAGLTSFPFCSYKPSGIGPKGGLVTFSKKSISKTTYQKLNLPIQSLRAFISKILIGDRGILVTETNGITVINVHLASYSSYWRRDKDDYLDNSSRLQLNRLINLIQKFRNCHFFVLSGDFNLIRKSPEYSYFLKSLKLFNFFANSYSPTYHQGFLKDGQKSHCVDYIFASQKASLIYRRNHFFKSPKKGVYVSDHIGLLVKFAYE